MTIYYLLILIPSLISISTNLNNKLNELKINKFFWYSFFILLVLIIGFRFEVGTDWGTYLNIYKYSIRFDYLNIFTQKEIDPGYLFVNKLSSSFGFGIYGVNIISGLLFLIGIYKFCSFQKNPWLALTISIPFLIITVGMGYTRQSAALGLMFYALIGLYNNKYFLFIFLILVASTFHDTAILYLSLLVFTLKKSNLKKFIYFSIFIFIFLIITFLFLNIDEELYTRLNYYYRVYIKNLYISSGALPRLTILFVASLFYLIFCLNRINFLIIEKRILIFMSLLCLMIFTLYFFITSNSFIDRLSIYLYPLYLTTVSLIPAVFNKTKTSTIISTFLILFLNFAILFVWLNYANYSHRWIPYNFIY